MRHWALKNRDKPWWKVQQIHSPAQPRLFRTTPPPWNLTRLPQMHSMQLIALWLCNKLTSTLTEDPNPAQKKISWLNEDLFWNFHWFLWISGSYLQPMVKSWGCLVLKRQVPTHLFQSGSLVPWGFVQWDSREHIQFHCLIKIQQ